MVGSVGSRSRQVDAEARQPDGNARDQGGNCRKQQGQAAGEARKVHAVGLTRSGTR